MKKFFVIETCSGDKEVVPSNWVLSSLSYYYWPTSCDESQLKEFLSTCSEPGDDWTLNRLLKVHYVRDSYAGAVNMAQQLCNRPFFKRNIQEIIQSDDTNDGNVKLSNNKRTKSNQQDLVDLAFSSPSTSTLLTGETDQNTRILKALSTLATAVIDIQEGVSELNKKVDLMTNNVKDDNWVESVLFLENYWPWKNESQMIEAETSMKDDQTIFYRNIKMLKRIGGIDRNSFVTNILKTTMVDDVAIQYSWVGKKKKKSFIASFPTFVKVISVVAQYHCRFNCQQITDEDIKCIVSRWLKQAKLRIFRAESKQENANDGDSSEESS